MHSHDRTLLSKLGFADKDKQNPLHDLACRYLVQPDQADKLIARCPRPNWNPRVERHVDHGDYRGITPCRNQQEWESAEAVHMARRETSLETESPRIVSAATEHPITKGEGQYKTVIGFLDGRIVFHHRWLETGTEWKRHAERESYEFVRPSGTPILSSRTVYSSVASPVSSIRTVAALLHFEVKVAECSVGDVLRQVNLYRQFDEGAAWFVAVVFRPSIAFVEDLKREGIQVITLGPKFHEWAETQRAQASDVEEL